MEEVELTILMPTLNEIETLEICINKAKQFIKQNNVNAEILIADNGSTDGSIECAQNLGVSVVSIEEKGYGNVLIKGTMYAKGKFVIMGDSDDSYNFLELENFLEKLRQGYELVIGNRYKGKMEKNAMKFTHRYFGTPVITKLAQLKYKIKEINDFNCGLRGYVNKKIIDLNCTSTGMEYATEMIIKAKINDLKIIEIPINFCKDGRTRNPHLQSVRDGIRHLKVIME